MSAAKEDREHPDNDQLEVVFKHLHTFEDAMRWRSEPTEEGRIRYDDPPIGFYNSFPCRCTRECSKFCKGECGCRACSMAYGDFLSEE